MGLTCKQPIKTLKSRSCKDLLPYNTLPSPALNLIYKSMFESLMRYGIDSWGSAFQSATKKIDNLQHKTLLNLTNRPFHIPESVLSHASNT